MSGNEMLAALNRWFLMAGMGLITLVTISAANAATLAGVDFADQATVAGKTLVLNGLGVRTATVLRVKVYVMGLYLERKSDDPRSIIESSGNKRVTLHFVHEVSADKLRSGWSEGFQNNNGDLTDIKAEIEKFNASMRDVVSGDSLVLDFSDDSVDVMVNDTRIDSVTGEAFQRALLSIWLGPEPPNDALKQGILGR
jgi:hypothetical protein